MQMKVHIYVPGFSFSRFSLINCVNYCAWCETLDMLVTTKSSIFFTCQNFQGFQNSGILIFFDHLLSKIEKCLKFKNIKEILITTQISFSTSF